MFPNEIFSIVRPYYLHSHSPSAQHDASAFTMQHVDDAASRSWLSQHPVLFFDVISLGRFSSGSFEPRNMEEILSRRVIEECRSLREESILSTKQSRINEPRLLRRDYPSRNDGIDERIKKYTFKRRTERSESRGDTEGGLH